MVDMVRRAKAPMLRRRDAMMRCGYEARRWREVRRIMVIRLVKVALARINEGKCIKRNGEVAKRCWKYGEAARNIFL